MKKIVFSLIIVSLNQLYCAQFPQPDTDAQGRARAIIDKIQASAQAHAQELLKQYQQETQENRAIIGDARVDNAIQAYENDLNARKNGLLITRLQHAIEIRSNDPAQREIMNHLQEYLALKQSEYNSEEQQRARTRARIALTTHKNTMKRALEQANANLERAAAELARIP